MATRTVIELIDDLDGSEATETIRFGLDGTEYEIDLAGQNAEALRGALTRFVEAGRKTAGVTRRQPTTVAPSVDTKAARRWAARTASASTRAVVSKTTSCRTTWPLSARPLHFDPEDDHFVIPGFDVGSVVV